jgi:cell wall-associated NlpC family hydrolase
MPRPRPKPTKPLSVDIAGIALNYQGEGYVYGGNASSPGDWDCSSFVSFVLHEGGISLPGGRWGQSFMPPNEHGPVVVDYVNWDNATAVDAPKAGDLCCWDGIGENGHIGIAINNHQMISALNPTDGTQVTGIQGIGPSGVPLVYRHVKGVGTIGTNKYAPVSGTPQPGKESWQAQIHASALHFNQGRNTLHVHTKRISQLTIRSNK